MNEDFEDRITGILDGFIADCSDRNLYSAIHDDPADDELEDTSDIDSKYAEEIIQEVTEFNVDLAGFRSELESALHSFYIDAHHDDDSNSGYPWKRTECVNSVLDLAEWESRQGKE